MKPITDSLILTWIIKAKEVHMNGAFIPGMCKAFKKVFLKYPHLQRELIHTLKNHYPNIGNTEGYNPEWLYLLIPEFNFDFLLGDKTTDAYKGLQGGDITIKDIYWWDIDDKGSRIRAFDKLIKVYMNGGAL